VLEAAIDLSGDVHRPAPGIKMSPCPRSDPRPPSSSCAMAGPRTSCSTWCHWKPEPQA